jgi:hypothetical protein
VLLNYGLTTNTFYCPGTAPRFADKQNWSSPGPSATLWNYDSGFRIVGYAFAFSGEGSNLTTNQNTSILPEPITLAGTEVVPPASERVLVADSTISIGAAVPGYAHPENNYVTLAGGFRQNGAIYPHVSPHLNGNVPIGGNIGFKDGHVAWRKFDVMTPRSVNGFVFWW